MQARTPVSLNVGGQQYRVVASVPEETLRRLASVVDDRIRAIVPKGKAVTPNAILLAAIALANEVEEERGKREAVEARSRDLLRRLLTRIDEALETGDADDDPSPVPPPAAF
ncbi:MAG: cell division protein ZapA [Deltaproteobacteria bacterium]|nr:cell division protein ZapA [Deltaproteobacteria bacterium]